MSSVLDYQDRVYDVSAFHGQKAVGDTLLTPTLLDDLGGSICVGVQKLAQRFLIEFLTEVGSMPLDPERGCSFMIELSSGRLRSETDLFVAFAFAVGVIGRHFAVLESADDPDDERFADAVLLRAVLSPGFAQLYIRVVSRAGDSRQVILPIPTRN